MLERRAGGSEDSLSLLYVLGSETWMITGATPANCRWVLASGDFVLTLTDQVSEIKQLARSCLARAKIPATLILGEGVSYSFHGTTFINIDVSLRSEEE